MSLFSMYFVNRKKNLILKRTLFDDFLIFIPLKLPTMVILKQQNTVKRVLFSCRGLCFSGTVCCDYYIFCK